MKSVVHLHVEKLPEGLFLVTSDDIPGLVAQGRSLQEAIEIARDVARKLIEVRASRLNHPCDLPKGTLRVVLERCGIEADEFSGC